MALLTNKVKQLQEEVDMLNVKVEALDKLQAKLAERETELGNLREIKDEWQTQATDTRYAR